jgi:cysteine desulfurase
VTSAYLDHAASTPMRPEALDALTEVAGRVPGNPSGSHCAAREARRLLDDARDVVADVVGCEPGEVVFTSGGTEADNLAVFGRVAAASGRPLCLETDHHAVLDPVRVAGGRTANVGRNGVVDLDALADRLGELGDVSLLSVALANNELGVIQPVAAIAEVVRAHAPAAVVHLDAVAAAAWLDLVPVTADAGLVSLSGHKVGGPKGIGALVVRRGTALGATMHGGSQEDDRRAGTQNVPGAVAFAAALSAVVRDRADTVARVQALRDRLEAELVAASPHLVATAAADGAARVANIAHLCARGVHRDPLLFRLDELGVAASAGSSCASGASEPSHVLAALDLPLDLVDGALRLSLGWTTTDADVRHAVAVIPGAVAALVGTSRHAVAP